MILADTHESPLKALDSPGLEWGSLGGGGCLILAIYLILRGFILLQKCYNNRTHSLKLFR